MPMYNLLEYSDKYSMTSGSLRNYCKDKVKDSANEDNDANNFIINSSKIKTSKSFEYKTKLIGSTPNNDYRLHTAVVVPLRYLSNFWKSIDSPSVNSEKELDVSWSRSCVIFEI